MQSNYIDIGNQTIFQSIIKLLLDEISHGVFEFIMPHKIK